MVVLVERNGVLYPCKNEKQLELFLAAGYTKVEEKKKKPATKK